MTSMIEPTIDQSLMIAHRHAGFGDIAHGLLTALRRVRLAVEEVGGYPMVSILDGAIRDRLPIYWSHCGLFRANRPDFFDKEMGGTGVRSIATRNDMPLKYRMLEPGSTP